MTLLASIIIPTFHAMDTIARALDSIVQQDHPQFEVLVVDDASGDQTFELVQRYLQALPPSLQTRYRCFASEKNGGPGAARNLGMTHANGQWLLFLDADDLLHPEALQKLVAHLGTASIETDVFAFDWAYINEQGPHQEGMRKELAGEAFSSQASLLNAYLLNQIDSSVIFHAFRRERLQAAGIRYREGYHEDVDFLFLALLHARQVGLTSDILYYKWNREGSIVNTLGIQHLQGYFTALRMMLAGVKSSIHASELMVAFMNGLINVTASRLMRLLNPAIVKTATDDEILDQLWHEVRLSINASGLPLEDYLAIRGSVQTKYQKIFSLFATFSSQLTALPTTEFMAELRELSEKSWSCYDLHHSVFLAPGEIRTCCKRFYYQKKFKGDVVLLKLADQPTSKLPYQEIVAAKNQLHAEINRDASADCKGCPFLAFEKWGKPLKEGIQYLSLEYQTVCNMRCTYCSDVYYGGKPALYQPVDVVQSMLDSNALAKCEYIVWGGGEPTLDKGFTKVINQIAQGVPQVKQRVITNATRFNPALAALMQEDRAFIVTSIDAGTQATFEAIRKYYNFNAVLRNLKRYADAAPHNVIVKYILMPENSTPEELEAFCQQVKDHGLTECNFQISCDFRSPGLSQEQALSLSLLYARLTSMGVRFVFMDDLVWQRLSQLNQATTDWIAAQLAASNLTASIESPQSYQGIVVWGTGEQAKLLMKKTHFLKQSQIDYFVDPRDYKVGTEFFGLPVKAAEALIADDRPILIAAVQSAPFIYQDMQKMGIDMNRVIKGLVL